MITRRIVLLLAAFLGLVLVAPRVAAAQQLDVIRGQVTGDDDDPIENANVTATSVGGGVNRSARTDRNGVIHVSRRIPATGYITATVLAGRGAGRSSGPVRV